jgi:hypothetical protein
LDRASFPAPSPPVLHFLLEARLLNFPIFYVDDLN